MFSEERKSIILEMLRENRSVSLTALMDRFTASETTIRRDLTELEQAGALKRTHGGAVSITNSVFEPNYIEKENIYLEEKRAIARTAAAMVREGDTVLLDAGTTTVEIARLLADKNITIITNSAIITSDYIHGKCDIEIYSTGGLFRPTTKSLVGPAAENFLRQIRPDKAFIAANGITLESGATTAHASEASIKSTMIGISKEAYLVVDHSKFGKEYFSVIAPAKAFTGIITDEGIPESVRNLFRRRKVGIITGFPKDI
jgi:DeoR family fructose operon transcriptional repressor